MTIYRKFCLCWFILASFRLTISWKLKKYLSKLNYFEKTFCPFFLLLFFSLSMSSLDKSFLLSLSKNFLLRWVLVAFAKERLALRMVLSRYGRNTSPNLSFSNYNLGAQRKPQEHPLEGNFWAMIERHKYKCIAHKKALEFQIKFI